MDMPENEINELTDRIQYTIDLYKKKKEVKFSWSRLASSIGLTPQAATNWKKGIISKDALQKIADFTNVDYYWLLTGKGSPNAQTAKNFGYIATTGIAAAALGPLGAGATALTVKLIDNRLQKAELNEISQIDINKFQIIRIIPKLNFEKLTKDISNQIQVENTNFAVTNLKKLGENAFATTVIDNAMSPNFEVGDEIIVDPDITPTPECYVVAIYQNSKAILRQFYEISPQAFKLMALKDSYADYAQQDEIDIIGTVVEHTKKLNI